MSRFEADDRWGQACFGYHVQARPDPASIARLQALQHITVQASPVALHIVPAEALHLSVGTLVPAQHCTEIADEQWSRIEPSARRELAQHPAQRTLSIAFDELKFTKHAVIVLTRDQPADLRLIRSNFDMLMVSLEMDFPRYDQAHITIARYAGSVAIAGLAPPPAERLDSVIRVKFEPVRLIRELRFPSLQTEVA